ncbi:hypothetical protein ACPV5S_19310 [Vibrio astriarenae]
MKKFSSQNMSEPNKILDLYVHSMNQIDDYFEYRCESDIDKRFVLQVLDELSKSLLDSHTKP